MTHRILFFAVVTTCVSTVASAGLITSEGHAVFGDDSITRDHTQGLDFLDLTFSTNRSFSDVSGEFGVGGDFEGFRYATEAEVINLINNFGFSPGAVAGSFVIGDTGGDQLSGLVDFLGPTVTGMTFRQSIGRTATPLSVASVRGTDIRDLLSSNDRVGSNLNIGNFASSESSGSFLVQPVPEPSSITMFGIGAGMLGIGWLRRRRKQTLSNH